MEGRRFGRLGPVVAAACGWGRVGGGEPAAPSLRTQPPSLGEGPGGQPRGLLAARLLPGVAPGEPGDALPAPTFFVCRGGALPRSAAACGRLRAGHGAPRVDGERGARVGGALPVLVVPLGRAGGGCSKPGASRGSPITPRPSLPSSPPPGTMGTPASPGFGTGGFGGHPSSPAWGPAPCERLATHQLMGCLLMRCWVLDWSCSAAGCPRFGGALLGVLEAVGVIAACCWGWILAR